MSPKVRGSEGLPGPQAMPSQPPISNRLRLDRLDRRGRSSSFADDIAELPRRMAESSCSRKRAKDLGHCLTPNACLYMPHSIRHLVFEPPFLSDSFASAPKNFIADCSIPIVLGLHVLERVNIEKVRKALLGLSVVSPDDGVFLDKHSLRLGIQ